MGGKRISQDQREGYGATYEDLASDIDRVSRHVARDYPDIDWEDVRQELALFVVKNGKSIKLREFGGNPRRLLSLVANQYCKDQRTQHMTLSPQYAYRPSDVSLILETAYLNRSSSDYVPDDARHPLSKTFNLYDEGHSFATGHSAVAERENLSDEEGESLGIVVIHQDSFHEMDFSEVSSDVREAAKDLKPELKEAIFNRYVLGQVPDNNSYERKKLNKAVNELTRRLNWYRGLPDRRRAMSNAASRAAVSEPYEGK